MSAYTIVIGNKNYSSWSLRPWLVMRHAGLAFAEENVMLFEEGFKEHIKAHSPAGLVPALVHGDVVVWDSLAICEYLNDLHPEAALWPADVHERAHARALSAEMHSGFTALRSTLPMNLRADKSGHPITEATQADIDRILAIWQECRERYGARGDFLFGHFTIADAMYAPVVTRLKTYGVSLPDVAQDYSQTIWTLPAFQDWLDEALKETAVIAEDEV